MDFNGVLTTVVAAIIIKLIEKGFEAKDHASNETLTLSQIRRQKILKFLSQFAIFATVAISLTSLGYATLRQKYFPRIEGCIESSNAYVYDVPSGNRGSPLSDGCYFFDRQDENGYWVRLSDRNKNIDGKWVQTSLVKFRLCKLDDPKKGGTLDCIFKK
ncbi:MAG: hypothetical protein ACOYYF_03910 [Chloroflexota bacterium]|nr:hypothetical protein [Chloroflexota bacterium]MBI5704706.1 hypothetical protein [Chloroflexota bacterium]